MGDFDFRNRCPKTRKLAIDMPIFLCVIANSVRVGLALSEVHSAAGSPIWQLVFISFAIVLILFEVLRGWRRGIARQVARLGALVAAYFAGFFGGNLVFPLMRPFFKMPDIVLSTLAGAALALIVYAIINGLGTIFFRRTSQHESVLVRLVYGAGGAVLGFFFGAFLVWLVVVGVRSIGAVAEAKVREQSSSASAGQPQAIHAVDVRRGLLNEPNEESAPLLTSLARLKNSLEMGVIGDAVKRTDVVPGQTYNTLGKIGQVVSNQESAQRFLSFPGADELSQHPKIVALRNDPEISQMIAQGHFVDLLQNEKIVNAANDPKLVQELKKFDLQKALDYATQAH
jgi:uncharacterized membrane protein required for colicin V production